ncbi:nuclear transport factor 2 family protein [Algoriphagus aestuarii]|nr:nuclear transport factor 2 family protein [Algoriphagus aestuarii]
MKKHHFLSLLFLISLSSFAQQNKLKDEDHIQNLIQESFDVLFSTYDLEKIENYYTPDIRILENGEIWDMEIIKGILVNAKQRNSGTRVNKFEFIETHVDGNMGYSVYHNYATISVNEEIIREIHWIESVVAVRTDQGWRIKNLHSFPAKKD